MKFSRTVLAVALACPALMACDSSETTGPTNQATVRFVNASSVAGLNFTANGVAGGQNVAFNAPSQCFGVNAGSATFGATVAGGTTAFGTNATQTLATGGRYTVVATGSATAPQYMVMSDAAAAPVAGRARLRVVNAVPGTTASDIFVTAPDAAAGTPGAANVSYGAASTFLDVPAGQTQIRFANTGTQTFTYTGTPFNVTAGETTTVIVAPGTTPGTFRTVLVAPCP
jgi:hypothetical protein